jgi:class 3 adenylate cyclase/tetratricopeptide (TPR) repeat protein
MTDSDQFTQPGNLANREIRDFRELRPVSILFCDIVDSTGISRRMSPEDFQELIVRFRGVCSRLTEEASGHIVETVGDCVLACFGYTVAHEEDPRRALRTALNIVRQVASDVNVRVRAAVATGTIPTGHPEIPFSRETTNLVARLVKVAEPGAVVIDARTHEVTHLTFECTDLGIRALKGFADPMRVWRVDSPREVAVRFDEKAQQDLTLFVDRYEELATLRGRWDQAQKARGQVVMLSGESGIGKSRLTQVFQDQIGIPERQLLRLQCFPDQRNSSLQPIIDLLRRSLDLKPQDNAPMQLYKLERFLAGWSGKPSQHEPIFAALMSIQSRHGPVERNPERLRVQIEAALLEYVAALARRDTCLLVVEDVHWADPTTNALLGVIVQNVRDLRLLLLATFREEKFDAPWVEMEHVSLLKLEALEDVHSNQLVRNLVASRLLSADQYNTIVSRGGGVPLFLEELTKNALETGRAESMPGPLESLLHARLDYVGEMPVEGLDTARSVKEVAQVAAVIGWEFSLELLEDVLVPDEHRRTGGSEAIELAIRRLVEADLIRRYGNVYRFSHVLIQEAAYHSLLQGKKDQLHARLARVLMDRGDHFGASPAMIASHCARAGLTDAAIQFFRAAGRKEAHRSSNQEAQHHFFRAIELSNALPDTLANLRLRLELHNDLGPVLMGSHGFADPSVERVYEHAVHLGARTGRPFEIYFPALAGLQLVRLVQGRHREAYQLGDELYVIAQEHGNPAYLIEAHRHRGAALFWMGEVARSRGDFEQVLELYLPERHDELKFVFGTDPRGSANVFLSMGASLFGRFRDAAKHGREALELAQASAHHHTQGYANLAVALSHDFRREAKDAIDKARVAILIGSEVPFWAAWAKVIYGRYLLKEGSSLQEGLDAVATGIKEYQNTGAGLAQTYFKLVSAEGHIATGNFAEALRCLEDGLVLTERGGEHFCEPELLRSKGEMLLRTGAIDDDVERCFQAALEMSKRRGVRLFELRAAVSLGRLWRGKRRQAEAKDRISLILDGIDLPADSVDFIEAGRILNQGGRA